MRRKLVLAVFVAVLAALYFTNPSLDDFKGYLQKKLDKARVGGQEDLEKLLVGLPEGLDETAVKRAKMRRNYYLWTVFEVPDREGKAAVRIMGFARKIFIPLGTERLPRDIPIY
jgi:hypothetical protein